jgi:hypothetical protein
MVNLLNSLVTMFNPNEQKISPQQFIKLRFNDRIRLLFNVIRKIGLRPKIIHSIVDPLDPKQPNQDELVLANNCKISCGIFDSNHSIFTIYIFGDYDKLLKYQQNLILGSIELGNRFGIILEVNVIEFKKTLSQLTVNQTVGKTSDINQILHETLKLIK